MACLACIFQSPSEGILNVHNMQMGPLSCSPLPQKARCLITTTGSGAMPSFFFFFFFLMQKSKLSTLWDAPGWLEPEVDDMTLWERTWPYEEVTMPWPPFFTSFLPQDIIQLESEVDDITFYPIMLLWGSDYVFSPPLHTFSSQRYYWYPVYKSW